LDQPRASGQQQALNSRPYDGARYQTGETAKKLLITAPNHANIGQSI